MNAGSVQILWVLSSVVAIWAAFGALFIGCGMLVLRWIGAFRFGWQSCLTAFWLGWAVIITLLQSWHLIFPIQWPALIPIAGGATAGLWANRNDLRRFLGRTRPAHFAGAALLVVVAAWLALRALDAPRNYDTGLYHLSALRWTQAYPVVPGLGNLHNRLAFNHSYFLYVALLEAVPWRISATHLASGLLLLPLFAQVLLSGWHLWQRPREVTPHDAFCALLLPVIVREATGADLSSPSPDLAVKALGMVVSARLLSLLTARAPRPGAPVEDVVAVALLTIIGITIKMSFVGFALGVFAALGAAALLGGTARRMANAGPRAFATLLVAAALIMGPWLIRGVVLSGYPVFPLSVGSLPVEWRVPRESVDVLQTWIVGYARASHPSERYYERLQELQHSWNWVGAWFKRIVVRYYDDTVVPVVLATLSSVVALWAVRRSERAPPKKGARLEWLWILPPLVSLVFWFLSAPAPRFLGSALVVLAPGILALTLDYIEPLRRGRYVAACVLAALALTGAIILRTPRLQTRADLVDAPTVPLKPFRTESGLTLLTPETPDQCWDAPLLCTPNPNQHLRLRHPNSLRFGFVVEQRAAVGSSD